MEIPFGTGRIAVQLVESVEPGKVGIMIGRMNLMLSHGEVIPVEAMPELCDFLLSFEGLKSINRMRSDLDKLEKIIKEQEVEKDV